MQLISGFIEWFLELCVCQPATQPYTATHPLALGGKGEIITRKKMKKPIDLR